MTIRYLIAVLLSVVLISQMQHFQVHKSLNKQVHAVATVRPSKPDLPVKDVPIGVKTVTEASAKVDASLPVTGCADYRDAIAQYSWNVNVAIAVCNAESNGNATNDNTHDYHLSCMGSRGLFQIGCDSTDNYVGMFDPYANIAQAYKLYVSRGWQPWSSTTCRYKVACY